MVAASDNAFALSSADVLMCLTHPSLLDTLSEMLGVEDANEVLPAMSADDFQSLMHGAAPERAAAEHSWLLAPPRGDVDLGEDVVVYRDLPAMLNSSLKTYELGLPTFHVRVVNDGSGSFFVCAWQLSLAHMHMLKRQRAQPGAAAAGPSGANSSGAHATMRTTRPAANAALGGGLEDVLARAQAALHRE